MREEIISYQDDQGASLIGQLVYDANVSIPRPAVLVAPDWSGCNDFARTKAQYLAKLGYVGFAIDVYGEGKTGATQEEKLNLMEPLMNNRLLLQRRMFAALNKIKTLSSIVNENKIAVIGFCFGGLCALDLARAGADIGGVVSFHGLLQAPDSVTGTKIKAKVLALHGYDDPMAPPAQVEAFAQEMTEAGADWQIHMYGHTQHAFTNPLANDPNSGLVHNALAEQRALLSMKNFLVELFI
jgi:dienelactone hydrolase